MVENEVVKVIGFYVRAVNGGGFIVTTRFDNPNALEEEAVASSPAKFKKIVKRLTEETIADARKA